LAGAADVALPNGQTTNPFTDSAKYGGFSHSHCPP
jgi:hypothetical protein